MNFYSVIFWHYFFHLANYFKVLCYGKWYTIITLCNRAIKKKMFVQGKRWSITGSSDPDRHYMDSVFQRNHWVHDMMIIIHKMAKAQSGNLSNMHIFDQSLVPLCYARARNQTCNILNARLDTLPTTLTHISLASFLWDIGKQNSPRRDAAKRSIPSGTTLFAYMIFIKK